MLLILLIVVLLLRRRKRDNADQVALSRFSTSAGAFDEMTSARGDPSPAPPRTSEYASTNNVLPYATTTELGRAGKTGGIEYARFDSVPASTVAYGRFDGGGGNEIQYEQFPPDKPTE
jgi:hypothetical protein